MVLQQDTSAKHEALSKRLLSLEVQAQMDKEDYANRLQQVHDEHKTSLDDMLAQRALKGTITSV